MLPTSSLITVSFSVTISFIGITIALFVLSRIPWFDSRAWDIHLVSATCTYLNLVFSNSILFSMTFTTFLGHFSASINIDLTLCEIFDSLFLISVSWLFNSFVCQALGRLFTVVYREYVQLRSMRTMFILISATSAYTVLVVTGNIVFKLTRYETDSTECSINLKQWKGLLYIILLSYMLPSSALIIIYSMVVRYMRSSSQATQRYQRTVSNRDLRVLQRIILITFVSQIFAFPIMALWTIGAITGQLFALSYRIEILCSCICLIILNVSLTFVNPQMKALVFAKINRRQVEPIVATTRSRPA